MLSLIKMSCPEGIFDNLFSSVLLKIYCELHNLKRTQNIENEYSASDYSGLKIRVNEQTYSFPVKILTRLK